MGYISAVAATGAPVRPVEDVAVLGFLAGYCSDKTNQNETIATATRAMLVSLQRDEWGPR
jgi:hypothetical protein